MCEWKRGKIIYKCFISGKTGSIRKKTVSWDLTLYGVCTVQTNSQTCIYIHSTNKHYHNHITTH